jgi:50S ribosomal protein L16 3-hydroxylase
VALPYQEFVLPRNFYACYWQRKPLVVRQALPGFHSPLSADELAGLACMDHVEARIVLEKGGATPWEVRHGPFEENVFESLPESHWSLLVQAVDHWDRDVAGLRRLFPAVPNWRLDDVMVSYAAHGGSVGPHFDHYDVFLLQGIGRRRWQLGGRVGTEPQLAPDLELNLLRDFSPKEEFTLEPGDALYLPPGYAHWGIADGECMTYSIGFRAPSASDIIDSFAAEVAERQPEYQRYEDPAELATAADHPGEITESVVQRVHDLVVQRLSQPALSEWLGAYVTAPKYLSDPIDYDVPAATRDLDRSPSCRPRDGSRFAFIRRDKGFDLFADGHRYVCPANAEHLVKGLCEGFPIAPADVVEFREIVLVLLRNGSLELE